MYVEYEIKDGKMKLYGFKVSSYHSEDESITYNSIDEKQKLIFKKDLVEAHVNGKILYPDGFFLNHGRESRFFYKEDFEEFQKEIMR